MARSKRLLLTLCTAVLGLCLAWKAYAAGGKLEGNDRERGFKMLEVLQEDLRKYHMDPELADNTAVFTAAKNALQQAETYDQLFGTLARAILDLGDPHTFFVPPGRAVKIDHGWTMQMIGDRCLVTAVKPGSDAEKQKLRPGDVLQAIDTFIPDRKTVLQVKYLYHVVTPRTGMRVQAQTGTDPVRILDIKANVQRTEAVEDPYIDDLLMTIRRSQGPASEPRDHDAGAVLVWKPGSLELEEKVIDSFFKKAQKKQGLVLDLRQNPGGTSKPLLRVVGSLFGQDLKVADAKLRDKTEVWQAKSRGKSAFGGTIVALVDSETASTAEVLARVLQLQKRGVVVGDTSAGAVRPGRVVQHKIGSDPVWEYSLNVTQGNLELSDGQSPEGNGVTPEHPLLPTSEDLAAGRDPVLAKAIELAGGSVTPEVAGKMFPIVWDAETKSSGERSGQALPTQRASNPRGGFGNE